MVEQGMGDAFNDIAPYPSDAPVKPHHVTLPSASTHAPAANPGHSTPICPPTPELQVEPAKVITPPSCTTAHCPTDAKSENQELLVSDAELAHVQQLLKNGAVQITSFDDVMHLINEYPWIIRALGDYVKSLNHTTTPLDTNPLSLINMLMGKTDPMQQINPSPLPPPFGPTPPTIPRCPLPMGSSKDTPAPLPGPMSLQSMLSDGPNAIPLDLSKHDQALIEQVMQQNPLPDLRTVPPQFLPDQLLADKALKSGSISSQMAASLANGDAVLNADGMLAQNPGISRRKQALMRGPGSFNQAAYNPGYLTESSAQHFDGLARGGSGEYGLERYGDKGKRHGRKSGKKKRGGTFGQLFDLAQACTDVLNAQSRSESLDALSWGDKGSRYDKVYNAQNVSAGSVIRASLSLKEEAMVGRRARRNKHTGKRTSVMIRIKQGGSGDAPRGVASDTGMGGAEEVSSQSDGGAAQPKASKADSARKSMLMMISAGVDKVPGSAAVDFAGKSGPEAADTGTDSEEKGGRMYYAVKRDEEGVKVDSEAASPSKAGADEGGGVKQEECEGGVKSEASRGSQNCGDTSEVSAQESGGYMAGTKHVASTLARDESDTCDGFVKKCLSVKIPPRGAPLGQSAASPTHSKPRGTCTPVTPQQPHNVPRSQSTHRSPKAGPDPTPPGAVNPVHDNPVARSLSVSCGTPTSASRSRTRCSAQASEGLKHLSASVGAGEGGAVVSESSKGDAPFLAVGGKRKGGRSEGGEVKRKVGRPRVVNDPSAGA